MTYRRSVLLATSAFLALVVPTASVSFAKATTVPPDDSAPFNDFPSDGDPARLAWLVAADRADPDSWAGGAPLPELVDGSRVLMIGDSVMASTARRYGDDSCETLVPAGWQVEVDAETGRFIDFGNRVLDRRLDDDFDVAVIMLGNNYDADREVFESGLTDMVERLAPRPTVLYSVSLYQPNRREVNEAIYEIATKFDNVRVIDWERATSADSSLTGPDRLHLSDAGRARFAGLLLDELGDAPGGVDGGDCLSSPFTDDSATSTGTTLPGQAPTPSLTTNPSSDGGGGGGGGTTADPTVPATDPPVTDPPPPVTDPPVTSPPVTDPPPPVTDPPGTPAPTNPPPTNPPPTNPPPTNPPPTNPPPPATG